MKAMPLSKDQSHFVVFAKSAKRDLRFTLDTTKDLFINPFDGGRVHFQAHQSADSQVHNHR